MSNLKAIFLKIDYERWLRADRYRIKNNLTWRFFMEEGINSILGINYEEILTKEIDQLMEDIKQLDIKQEKVNKKKAEKQKQLLEVREREKEEELLKQREAIILSEEIDDRNDIFDLVTEEKIKCDYCSKKFPPDELGKNPRTKKLYCNSCSKIVIKEERKIQIRT